MSSADHDCEHSARGQRLVRSSHAQEEMPGFGGGTGTAQIGRDGAPDIDRQGQAFVPVPFAPHDDLASAPVDVIQFQGGDLAGAQAQSDEHGQDREVTPAGRGAAVTGGQQLLRLADFQRFGQAG